MDMVIELLLKPNYLLVVTALVLFVSVMSTTTPDKMFKYTGGAIEAEFNSGRAAFTVFIAMVVFTVQIVSLVCISPEYQFLSTAGITLAGLMESSIPALKLVAAVYASGFLFMPVVWTMLNKSYIEAVKRKFASSYGYEDFERSAIRELRKKLISYYENAIVVSSNNNENGKIFHELKPGLYPSKYSGEENNTVGIKGIQSDVKINNDAQYVNVANKESVDLSFFNVSAMDRFCDLKHLRTNELFAIVTISINNRFYGPFFNQPSVENPQYNEMDTALALVNCSKVNAWDLKSATPEKIKELCDKNLIAPIPEAIFDEEVVKSSLADIFNVINSARSSLALSPSVMATQLAIVTFNWPVYVTAQCTSKLRRAASGFVMYFKNLLRVMSENATEKL